MTDDRVSRAVAGQISWWWNTIFRPRLEGLTDEEYLWEPVDGCWTIHAIDEDRVRIDHRWPPPQPAPVTTIGWRLVHIGVGCLATRTTALFPSVVAEPWVVEQFATEVPFPASAAGALGFLDHWWGLWRGGLEAVGDEALWQPIGDVEGGLYADNAFAAMQLGADDPRIGLVLHVHRELMHHGAEISLLRDLFGARTPLAPFIAACLRGDEAVVEELCAADAGLLDSQLQERPALVLRAVETGNHDAVRLAVTLGFDVNFMDELSPLHHAAAAGDVGMAELLVALGADLTLLDATYASTPAGWAEFFQQAEVGSYLRGLEEQ